MRRSIALEGGKVKEQHLTLHGLDGAVHDKEGERTSEPALDRMKACFQGKLNRKCSRCSSEDVEMLGSGLFQVLMRSTHALCHHHLQKHRWPRSAGL